jgi:hypothetical protein
MSEKKKTSKDIKKRAIVLGILGVLLMIVGIGIINIHNPLRGSGMGTLSLLTGIVMIIIAISRYSKKTV